MDRQQQQLWWLSIFHYVMGGIVFLVGLSVSAHLTVAELLHPVSWLPSACFVFAGRCLATHKCYTYCLVIALIEFLFVPIGTLLGVATIYVLMRPTVKQLFYDGRVQPLFGYESAGQASEPPRVRVMDRTQKSLRLLAIAQYIAAGLVGLTALVALVTGISELIGDIPGLGPWLGLEGGAPEHMELLFLVVAALLGIGALQVVEAGQSLATQRRYRYCLAIAAIECLFVPIGTIIGALTILVLMRPAVKERFGPSSDSPG